MDLLTRYKLGMLANIPRGEVSDWLVEETLIGSSGCKNSELGDLVLPVGNHASPALLRHRSSNDKRLVADTTAVLAGCTEVETLQEALNDERVAVRAVVLCNLALPWDADCDEILANISPAVIRKALIQAGCPNIERYYKDRPQLTQHLDNLTDNDRTLIRNRKHVWSRNQSALDRLGINPEVEAGYAFARFGDNRSSWAIFFALDLEGPGRFPSLGHRLETVAAAIS